MSAGEILDGAHKAIAKGLGQINIMLQQRQISKGALEEALSSIDDGVLAIRTILGPPVEVQPLTAAAEEEAKAEKKPRAKRKGK